MYVSDITNLGFYCEMELWRKITETYYTLIFDILCMFLIIELRFFFEIIKQKWTGHTKFK